MAKIRDTIKFEKQLEFLQAVTENNQHQIEQNQVEISDNGNYTVAGILNVFAQGIIESKPTIDKKGYKLVPMFKSEKGTVVWEYVKDDNFVEDSGSYTNPIPWVSGMHIVAGLNPDGISDGYYIYDDTPKRCIKDGSPDSFYDLEYWEDF